MHPNYVTNTGACHTWTFPLIIKMSRPVLHRWAHGHGLLSGGLRHHHHLFQSHGNVKGRQVAVSVNGRRRGQWAQAHGRRKDAGGSCVRSAPVRGACSRRGEPFAIWFHAAVNCRATVSPILSVFRFIVFIRNLVFRRFTSVSVSTSQFGVRNILLTSSHSHDRRCSRRREASDRPAVICFVTWGRARLMRSSRFAATHSAFLWHYSPNRKTHTNSQCSLKKCTCNRLRIYYQAFITGESF